MVGIVLVVVVDGNCQIDLQISLGGIGLPDHVLLKQVLEIKDYNRCLGGSLGCRSIT
jgi:hypothetical protein